MTSYRIHAGAIESAAGYLLNTFAPRWAKPMHFFNEIAAWLREFVADTVGKAEKEFATQPIDDSEGFRRYGNSTGGVQVEVTDEDGPGEPLRVHILLVPYTTGRPHSILVETAGAKP